MEARRSTYVSCIGVVVMFLLALLVACLAAASASAAAKTTDEACAVLALFAPVLLAVFALLVWIAIHVLARKKKNDRRPDDGERGNER